MRWLIVMLLCVPLVLGHGHAEYWTVVYDDAPASDVVSAANFAATMKSSTGASFTGKTLTQAQEDFDGWDEGVIVVFEDDDAIIMYQEFEPTVDAAVIYLNSQGFETDTQDVDYRLFSPEIEDEVIVEEPEPEPVDSVAEDLQKIVVLADHDEPEPQADPAPEPEDNPNVIVRIWRWFAGIFS